MGAIDEQTSPVFKKGDSPRTDHLLNAEEEVLKVGGNVVRLAGLYISFINYLQNTIFLHFFCAQGQCGSSSREAGGLNRSIFLTHCTHA